MKKQITKHKTRHFDKTKKGFKLIFLLVMTLFFVNCQNESLNYTDSLPAHSEAKIWFEQNPDLPLKKNNFFRDAIDWENSFTNENKLYVPFLDSSLSLNSLENGSDATTTSRPYLVFSKTKNESYKLNLEVYFSDNFIILENAEVLKLPFIKIDEKNQLLSNNSTSITRKSAEAPEPVCEVYGVYEHEYDTNTGETISTLLYTFKVCGSDWNWNDEGSGGGGVRNNENTTTSPPPSCQSFNFSKTASLWQTALVKNISFKIILLDAKGVTFMHSAKFSQPISFGMPTNLSVGGDYISPGLAAELSAKALQTTIKEVVQKYGKVKVSEMIVEQYFKERLLFNYPMITSGGRVNWTATENLPVTDYETTFMLPDDCE